MSMFYELMMRKKEETLYPVIKGSLTESPEGVFSGFSTTSYLTLSTIDLSNSFEILLKVKTPSTWGTDSGIIINSNYSNANRFIVQKDSSNKRFQYRIPTYDQSGYVNYYSPTTILEDTYYYIKFVFNGSSLVVSRSTDNTNWEIDVNKSRSQGLPSNAYTLGRNANLEQQQWGGSIDLNNSYIKIGSTKYNLQAVVGYTIVGSPTIVDGVVSGFSTANYLTLNKSYTLTQNDNIEIYTRFKVDTLTGNKVILNIGGIWSAPLLSAYTNYISGQLMVDMGIATTQKLEVDTYYRLKIIMKDGISKGYLYNDDESVRAEKTINLSFTDRTGNFLLCAPYGTSNPTINSLDLNNTYIKINNKLWFNGQQA